MPNAIKWKETFIDIKAFNEKLNLVRMTRNIKIANAKAIWQYGLWTGFKKDAYVWDTGHGSVHLAYRMAGQTFNYVVKLDGTDEEKANEQILSGGSSYRLMQRYNKLSKVHPEWHSMFSGAKALQYHNETYNGCTIEHAWGYDMNSAYCHILMHYDFPDIEKPLGVGMVENGQIGFNGDFTRLVHAGGLAVNRYSLMPSPYKKFAETRFEKIKALRAAGKKAESQKFKSMLTNSVGYLAHARPVDRWYIILSLNEIMNKYIDEYGDKILFANTDSLVSTVPIDTIDVGDNCGQFKIEHANETFQYEGAKSCWIGQRPKVSGKPTGFWRPGDTLANLHDDRAFKYKLDMEVWKIVETEKSS